MGLLLNFWLDFINVKICLFFVENQQFCSFDVQKTNRILRKELNTRCSRISEKRKSEELLIVRESGSVVDPKGELTWTGRSGMGAGPF